MKKVFKAKVVCKACGGTGLYKGFAEAKGCAVICNSCDGTGCYEEEFEYEIFEKRKKADGVKRVFRDGCGYQSSPNDVEVDDEETKEKWTIKYSEGGCTYEEWTKGADPKPVKSLYCPYQWESQSMQHDKHKAHKMYKDMCNGNMTWGCISDCKNHRKHNPERMKKCWEIYEELMNKKGNKK